MPETPEQKARREIDVKLTASGWLVQNRDDLDLTASRGIAAREFPMKSGFGFADYLAEARPLPPSTSFARRGLADVRRYLRVFFT